jgi:hypothetical protein
VTLTPHGVTQVEGEAETSGQSAVAAADPPYVVRGTIRSVPIVRAKREADKTATALNRTRLIRTSCLAPARRFIGGVSDGTLRSDSDDAAPP